jgi:shikimate dehydrogenase
VTNISPVLAAVVGTPITHSLSPAIYRAAFAAQSVAGEYSAIDADVDSIHRIFEALMSDDVRGLSVTMPLKEAIIPLLQAIDEDAALLHAVNCVDFKNGIATGHNTDGDGCCDALEQQGGALLGGTHAVVLGAGGTARSVALALGRRGARVAIINRTAEKAEELVRTLGPAAREAGGDIVMGTAKDIGRAGVLVNTTSVGMNSDEMPISANVLHRNLVVLDAVYSPMDTALLQAARQAGAVTVDGLWMLIQQARRQCVYQFGWNPEAGPMREAAERELASRRK